MRDRALDRVFSPGRIGSLRLPHRIVMGAMHLGIEDSDADADTLAEFYAARARGGAGLIVTGGSAVSRVGAAGRHYGFINEPADQRRWAAVTSRVHTAGGLIALQLFHAGRYARRADFGLQPVAPSSIASRFDREPPHALNTSEIAATIDDFASGARAAQRCGFDAVEIMGSEGYLLNQFCSPLTNVRDDAWGGDAARRRAFPLAVVGAVRDAVGPDFPVLYRMSGNDLMPGSSSPADTAALAQALAAAGTDALNVGVGWHESAVPTVQHLVPGGSWTPEAALIKQAVGPLPVIAGNRINRLAQAADILATGAADFVSMSRPLLADPDMLRSARAGRPINICIGCDQACIDRSLVDEPVSCLVNPDAVRPAGAVPPAGRRARSSAGRRARYLVIGGGPAGLAAAREWGLRGQRVTVLEAAEELGGQFRMARWVPGKADYGGTIDFYAAELRRLGVEVVLRRRVEPDEVADLIGGVAGVVVATGVLPRQASIDGLGGDPGAGPGGGTTEAAAGGAPQRSLPVLAYPEAFTAARAGRLTGSVAIIGGGGIAVDLAHLLTGRRDPADPSAFRAGYGLDRAGGRSADAAVDAQVSDGTVTIMRRSGKIGAGIGRTMRWPLVAELRRHGVRMLTDLQYRRITGEGVCIDHEGRVELIASDTVVVAAGQVPNAALQPALAASGVAYRLVGGARSTDRLDAVRAFAEGVEAARDLLRGDDSADAPAPASAASPATAPTAPQGAAPTTAPTAPTSAPQAAAPATNEGVS